MNQQSKTMAGVAFLLLLVLVSVTFIPDFLASRKEVRRMVKRARISGSVALVQFVNTPEEKRQAEDTLRHFLARPKVRLEAGVFYADVNREFLKKYGVVAPGYVIISPDEKAITKANGIIAEPTLLAMMPNDTSKPSSAHK